MVLWLSLARNRQNAQPVVNLPRFRKRGAGEFVAGTAYLYALRNWASVYC
jgi:hypothetical protein